MITVRQIQRLWSAKAYDRLLEQLLAPRSEASAKLYSELTGPDAAAAMLVIRLDELSQTFAPLYSETLRFLLTSQRMDGSWGDPMTTAIVVRALLCGNGHGGAITRGIEFLAGLQKPEGVWPAVPVRRMPADAFASAFVLLQLGDQVQFQEAVRFDDAIDSLNHNELASDLTTRKLWNQAKIRCRATTRRQLRARESSPDRGNSNQASQLINLFAIN